MWLHSYHILHFKQTEYHMSRVMKSGASCGSMTLTVNTAS